MPTGASKAESADEKRHLLTNEAKVQKAKADVEASRTKTRRIQEQEVAKMVIARCLATATVGPCCLKYRGPKCVSTG